MGHLELLSAERKTRMFLSIRFRSASIATIAVVRAERLIENRAALDVELTEDDLVMLDRAFLPAKCRSALGRAPTLARVRRRMFGFIGET